MLGAQKNLYWTLCLSLIAYLLAGTVSTLVSGYLPVIINELLNKTASEQEIGKIGAFINALFIFGWAIGGIIMGVISDKIGRKNGIVFSVALYGITTFLIVFVQNSYWLMAYRFLAGIGVGGTLVLTTVLISEIWPNHTKAIVQGILSTSFPIGIVATGSLNIIFSNWRQAFYLGLIPIFAAIFFYFTVYESEVWTNKSVRLEESNHLKVPIIRNTLITASLIFGSVLIGLWGLFSWLPTWVQTILPAGADGNTERGLTMMLLGMGGILGSLLSGFIIKKLGDRTTLIIAFWGLIVFSAILFMTNHQFHSIIYFEIIFLALFFGISQGCLSNYIPELFPVNIRASGTGLSFNIGRLFTAAAVFFTGALVTILGGFSNALLLFSLTFAVALIATYRSPLRINNGVLIN